MLPNTTTVRYRVTGERPSHTYVPADVTLDDAGQALQLYLALRSAGYVDVTAQRIITTVEKIHYD